jgi:hypothetical protein
MREKIDIIIAELAEIKRGQQHNAVRLQRVERKLIGDKEYGDKGMIDTVNEHQEYIQAQKVERAKVIGFAAAAGASGGGLFAWIKHLFVG